ncbi:MAG TPA: response regulator transcription factor [Dehalococcoidia bacterium]|nr:response regulator transcription factor [Dehalococcoidia bacterium]
MNGYMAGGGVRDWLKEVKRDSRLPVMALIARDRLDGIDVSLDIDDLIISPADNRELVLRIKRLLSKRNGNQGNGELITCDGLVIDLAKCEVMVDGNVVDLTFREYELLKFLASNRGRVYTRDALLNKVWGYDYYGGDRTVDVHIRRLRSKIEDAKRTFIETVRNIGYRFTSGHGPRM